MEMEHEIIETPFEVVTNIEELSTEQLTDETNYYYAQMQLAGALTIRLAAEAGSRLAIIKSRVGHGNWESWAEDHLNFSKRKANNMMLLAKKAEESGFLANPQTFADLSISKVWKLLAAPEEVAEEVAKNPEAADMTVKKFEEEIKLITEENERLRRDNADLKELERERDDLEETIDELRTQLAENQAAQQAEDKTAELRAQLAEAEGKLAEAKAKEKEKLAKAKEKARAEAQAEAEKAQAEAIEKARAEALSESKAASELLEAELTETKDALAKLQKTADPVVSEFKAYADQLQSAFSKCLECAERDPDRAAKMKAALGQVLDGFEAKLK